jgi:minor extracellular serine protease Vpr
LFWNQNQSWDERVSFTLTEELPMRLRSFSARAGYLLTAITLLFFITVPDGASLSAQQRVKRTINADRGLKRMMIPGTGDLQLIIELADQPLLARMQAEASLRQAQNAKLGERNRKMDFESAQALAHRGEISRGQEAMKRKIGEFPGVQILGTTDTLMNTIIVRVPAEHYNALRRLAGVKKVYFSRPRRMLLDQAAAIHNAQNLWAMAGGQSKAGQGIKIGIIDSGIDITNPMFSSAGLSVPSGYPRSDSVADRAFTNSKVIVARNFISLLSYPQTVQTATDEIGHGTFVAGCAAGVPVSAPLASISGMAPGAFLGNYKILGTPGTNDSTTSAAEIAAIDAAVSDGMDVINMSIGALDYLPPDENAEYVALNRAVDAGLIVTISAGNAGPHTSSISNPGTLPNVITVGSVTNAHQFLAVLRTSSPGLSTVGYLPSADGIQVSTDMPLAKVVDVSILDGNGLGCSAFSSGTLLSSIAFVQRGTCTFAVKVANAVQAGATAVVVYNNVDGGLISMSGLGSATIPAIMISLADGTALKQYINANPTQAQVGIGRAGNLQSVATTPRIISSFSSVGPGTDFSIKPDLVAVGEYVYSATEKTRTSGTMYDATGYTIASGTSFSSPMVAGAAAGLLQLHPDFSPLDIKSILITTASKNVTADGIRSANVLEAGGGLLDMEKAAAATAIFSPTSLNFGVRSYSGTLSVSAPLTIRNISSNSDRLIFGIEPMVTGPSITFSESNTGDLASGASKSIVVSLQIAAPATGGFQGFITVTSTATAFVYRIPYWAGLYVPDSTRVLKVSQSAPGAFSDLGDAIAAAQPGNVIELDDNSTYSTGDSGLTINTNSQGLPLHSLTIRAAAGKTPVIEVPSSTTGIMIVGLKNVLLQGLKIQGGFTGVELWQPSKTVPLSVTINQCDITNSVGGVSATGVFVDGGGTVDITSSNLSNSTGTGLVTGYFASGTQLTVTGSTFQGNGYDGMDAYNGDIHIANSTFSNNIGAGAYLENCTGTVTENTFSGNQTVGSYYGDGLQIADGNVTIQNNLHESNEMAGIALFSANSFDAGPKAQIIGNRIRGNGDYGIYSSPATYVYADRNFVGDNAGGAYLYSTGTALFTNNIIVRSTDSIIGDGVEADGSTSVRLINNTIYGNTRSGVLRTNGSVSVVNSIINSNTGGDTKGSVSLSSSLSGSQAANPQFVAPAQNDFSVASTSPVIDAGSNTAADLPFLDYYGRLRVASTTGLPGQGQVDIGAIEQNSAYPLVYPLILSGSDTTIGGPFRTGVAFVNPASTAANYYFTGYKGDGSKLAGTSNPSPSLLVPEAQLAQLDYDMFGYNSTASARGSVLGTSDSPTAGFVFIADIQFQQFATGANASVRLAKDLVFMRHESGAGRNASYVVFNPGVNSATITAKLQTPGGAKVDQQTATIAQKGHVVLQFPNASTGYVRVESDRPVSGIELVGNQQVMAALGGFAPSTHARLFFPHFAVGGNYSTRAGIINSGSSTATVTLNAYGDSGILIGSYSMSLLPGEQQVKTITELFGISAEGPIQAGYLIAQSDQAGIMGFTDFSYSDGGRNSDATIPADSVPSRRLLFSHIAHGVSAGTGVPYQTGIALLNPFGTTVSYTISVYNGAGTLVAHAQKTIGPHEKVAKLLSFSDPGIGFFDQNLLLGNGHIEVTSDYGLMGLELFFTEDLSQMASVPAQISE